MMARLFEAQRALLLPATGAAARRSVTESLRTSVPEPILAHFLRLVGQGRKAVALVRHGVCSECHIRVPSSIVAVLVKPKDVHLCEQCGCYLLLPAEETPAPPIPPSPAATPRRGRKSHRALAA
jgi:hypothetical protein